MKVDGCAYESGNKCSRNIFVKAEAVNYGAKGAGYWVSKH